MKSALLLAFAASSVACATPRLVPPLRYTPAAVAADDGSRAQSPELAPTQEPPVEATRSTTLSNGLTVVLVERHGYPLVAASLLVDGRAQEPDDAGGRRLQMMGYLFERGGDKNTFEAATRAGAASGFTVQTYAMGARGRGPVTALDDLLDAMASLTYRARLTRDEYEYRSTEWTEATGERGTYAVDAERKILFGESHPAGYLPRPMKAMPRGDAQVLHDRIFQPGHAALVVVGDVQPDRLDAAVARAFGEWPKKDEASVVGVTSPLEHQSPRISIYSSRGLAQIHASVFARGPDPASDDAVVLPVLAAILGGANSSRLFEQLREASGDAYAAEGDMAAGPGVTWLAIRASFDSDKAIHGVQAILAAIRRVRAGHVSPDELAVAREVVAARLLMAMSTLEGAAHVYATSMLGPAPSDPQKMPARIAAVSAEDVARVAKAYLTNDALRVYLAGEDRWLQTAALGMGDAQPIDMTR
jgi:zinc protease